jgi:hypothetical protein
MRFLVDENLAASCARDMREAGSLLEEKLAQGVLVTIDPRGVRLQPLPVAKK